METVTLDEIDRQLVHALQVDGRAPFARIGDVLGVSDRTVARRYGRLRSAGVLRVIGVPNSQRLGRVEYFVRLRCLPEGALPIAHVLGRREDISWVMLTSAGTEITCLATSRTRGDRDALLLGTLPRTRPVVEVDALCVLRTFFGGASGWNGRADQLSAAQVDELAMGHGIGADTVPLTLDDEDETLLAELRKDGRIGVADLAAVLACSQSTATRRLDRLLSAGALFFDVEIAPIYLGFDVEALLWVDVMPAELDPTARAAAAHPQVALAAATSGSTNLLLAVGCRDHADLYQYVTHHLGQLPGVRRVQTAPLIRTIKRAGALIEPAATKRRPASASRVSS